MEIKVVESPNRRSEGVIRTIPAIPKVAEDILQQTRVKFIPPFRDVFLDSPCARKIAPSIITQKEKQEKIQKDEVHCQVNGH